MSDLRVEALRGGLVESVHRVSAAVVHADGRLIASAGDPGLRTFWRSAAKPFQALPILEDGAAERFGLTDEELALACASHSSEPRHLAVTDRFLARIGVAEADLACGPHPPLGVEVAARVAREGMTLSPRWSNCSGKHSGMLALARHHGWRTGGYTSLEHPVQQRILESLIRWTGLDRGEIGCGVDGGTTVSFFLPLAAMASAWARWGASDEPGASRLRQAFLAHPHLVAGEGRFCTDLMTGWPVAVLAKVGADGVYCAALPGAGIGIALKMEDGDMRSSPTALFTILRMLGEAGQFDMPVDLRTALAAHVEPAIRDTRGGTVGVLRAAGTLRFED